MHKFLFFLTEQKNYNFQTREIKNNLCYLGILLEKSQIFSKLVETVRTGRFLQVSRRFSIFL